MYLRDCEGKIIYKIETWNCRNGKTVRYVGFFFSIFKKLFVEILWSWSVVIGQVDFCLSLIFYNRFVINRSCCIFVAFSSCILSNILSTISFNKRNAPSHTMKMALVRCPTKKHTKKTNFRLTFKTKLCDGSFFSWLKINLLKLFQNNENETIQQK